MKKAKETKVEYQHFSLMLKDVIVGYVLYARLEKLACIMVAWTNDLSESGMYMIYRDEIDQMFSSLNLDELVHPVSLKNSLIMKYSSEFPWKISVDNLVYHSQLELDKLIVLAGNLSQNVKRRVMITTKLEIK